MEKTGRTANAERGAASAKTTRFEHGARRLLAVVLIALMVLLPFAATALPAAWADGVFASGSGTASDPYLIETTAQLEAFRDSVNAGTTYEGDTIRLGADLDIGGSEWTPIGAGTRSGSGTASGATPFDGTFDGAGHTVSGLTITSATNAGAALGLFGIVNGGTVENLKLTDVNVRVATSELAGGAVGLAVGGATVSGVEVSGSVSGSAGVGGVVGRMTKTGTITGCTNHATVSAIGTGNAGGIVGAAYYTVSDGQMTISDCANTGDISGSQAIGGIAGLCSAFVSDCTNSGTVTASNYSVGGIVGEQKNYGAVNGCTNSGAVTNSSADGYGTGGIIGWIRYDGAATAYLASATVPVTDNTNTAAVKGGNDAGGIVGCLYDAGVVSGNTNEAPSLSSSQFAGGIVGNLQNIDASALPTGVADGIEVVNNVSTTPLDAIDATLKGQFAYNNDAADFTVADNGTAWVAEANHTKFATLARALNMAGADGTVTLLANVPDAATIAVSDGGTTTLDLNGHTLGFAASPAVKATSGKLVVAGSGIVLSDGDDLADLASVDPADGATAALALQGGTYRQDVQPYLDEGYAELVLHEPVDGARYEVLPAGEAADAAVATVTDDGKVTYYENLDDAKAALADEPGATLTVLPTKTDDGTVPDGTTTAGATPSAAPTSQVGASAAAGVKQTGDAEALPIVILCAVAAGAAGAAGAACVLFRKRRIR